MENKPKKVITRIDANPLLSKKADDYRQLRVAAYCRVSTDSEDQIESYKAQVAYYTDAIAKNPRWKFVDIYADEGITGTLTKKRDSFNRMIEDCRKGRIDLILTKSVSRFARNTVDALRYVRKLKSKGIGIYFEEQCLDTLKAENEMALGLHSVIAQSESENISANVRWGIQQRMKSGTFKFKFNLLGYRKGADGEPEIIEEEAVVIRKIFNMYMEGKSLGQIKNYLEENHIKTKKGKSIWDSNLVKKILENEKYCGDMLMQKTYVENCISKKSRINRGELPKYLITNNHPAIIDKELFKAVQCEIARRNSKRRVSDKSITENGKYSGKYALTGLVYCSDCGSVYRRKTWKKKNGQLERKWMCISRMEHGKQNCENSPIINEDTLQEAICRGLLKVYNDYGGAMDVITASLTYAISGDDGVMDIYNIEKQIKRIDENLDETVLMRERTMGDKSKYDIEIKRMTQDLISLKQQLEIEKAKIDNNATSKFEIERIKEVFKEKSKILTFSDSLVRTVIECIRVLPDNEIKIILKGGYEIVESLNTKNSQDCQSIAV